MKTRTGTLTFVKKGTPEAQIKKGDKTGMLQFIKNLQTDPPQRKTKGSKYV